MKTKFIITILFALILTSCILSPNLIVEDFPSRLLLASQDLPSNWQRTGLYVEEVPNALARLVVYQVNGQFDKTHLNVSHFLAEYSTEQLANEAYSLLEKKFFPTNDKIPPVLKDEFNPVGQYSLGCMEVKVNDEPFLSCTYLQVYKTLVSRVLTNIDHENLTVEQFINALRILDLRLQQWQLTQ